MPRTPESSRQQLLQETVRSFWILGLKKSWGVSQKQLRSGMETSSCQPAQIPCFHRPLSGTQKTNTSLRFSPRVAPAHHPQAPPPSPPAYLPSQRRCHQLPWGATHPWAGGSPVDRAPAPLKAELCLGGSKAASQDAGLL